MTDEFKQYVDELAKGINFPDNAAVMGTAIHNEKDQMYDITVHFGTQRYYPVECIIHSIVKEFLNQLDNETSAMARSMLLAIIEDDERMRKNI